jgi:hypothetical protein
MADRMRYKRACTQLVMKLESFHTWVTSCLCAVYAMHAQHMLYTQDYTLQYMYMHVHTHKLTNVYGHMHEQVGTIATSYRQTSAAACPFCRFCCTGKNHREKNTCQILRSMHTYIQKRHSESTLRNLCTRNTYLQNPRWRHPTPWRLHPCPH